MTGMSGTITESDRTSDLESTLWDDLCTELLDGTVKGGPSIFVFVAWHGQ